MNSDWSFSLATKVHCGCFWSHIETRLSQEHTLILVSKSIIEKKRKLFDGLLSRHKEYTLIDKIPVNPSISYLDEFLETLGHIQPTQIFAIGGGSVLDTAKAISLFLSNRDKGCLSNYFAGTCDLSSSESIPVVAVPTTAGSGAEVTPFATIWDDQANIKRSIDDIRIQPKECILDPSFLRGTPKRIIASSGIDSLAHALESIWNKNASPMSLMYASASLSRSLKSLAPFI